MMRARYASIPLLVLALAACEGRQESAPGPTERDDAGVQEEQPTVQSPEIPAEEFLAGLQMGFPHEVTSHRQVQPKGGGMADVFAIDYRDGSVRDIDRQLAEALAAAGFERGERTTVPGGVRVNYEADDGRRVSTMIRNKKYFGDRIADTSTGQISLSYVPH